VKLPFVDRIWRARNSLPLETPLSAAEVFERLDPLIQTQGTTFRIEGNVLTYHKHNPAAQDRLATFTRGTLRVDAKDGRSWLSYDLTSPALLFCFLAPLLFLAFGQAIVAIGAYENAKAEANPEEEKKDEEKDEDVKLHPLDVFLGAPVPEKKDDEEKESEEKKDDKYSPKAAYILAAIFAALYVAGRILEPWLVRSRFRKALSGELNLPTAGTADDPVRQ